MKIVPEYIRYHQISLQLKDGGHSNTVARVGVILVPQSGKPTTDFPGKCEYDLAHVKNVQYHRMYALTWRLMAPRN